MATKPKIDKQANRDTGPTGDQATTTPCQPEYDPPDLETLMAWEAEGYCETLDGCVVEPDGVCEHGCPSWLLELGLI